MKDSEVQSFNPMALDNQICFALYVCSKEIIRKYGPLLEPLGLTYTAYITLLCLWEKDNIPVKELGERLFLDSGTLTPLLKKMEKQGLISRTRSNKDERTVYIQLTVEGRALKEKCNGFPHHMMCYNLFEEKDVPELLRMLHGMMKTVFEEKEKKSDAKSGS